MVIWFAVNEWKNLGYTCKLQVGARLIVVLRHLAIPTVCNILICNIMIKRTLYFGNPAYLSMRNAQLVIHLPEVVKNNDLPESFKKEAQATIPIEDLGVVLLDHKQITITQGLLEALLANNVAVITCDSSRMPVGLLLPLSGNTVQSERFQAQIDATVPLRKQLWQQTVQAKISNQASVLDNCRGAVVKNMRVWANDVKSGDSDNLEARAAAYYW